MSEELIKKQFALSDSELISSMWLPSGSTVSQDPAPENPNKIMNGTAGNLIVIEPSQELDNLSLTEFDMDIEFKFSMSEMGAVKQRYVFSMLLKNGLRCQLNAVYQIYRQLKVYWNTRIDNYGGDYALDIGTVPVVNVIYPVRFEFRRTTCLVFFNGVSKGAFATNAASSIDQIVFGGVVGNGNYMSGTIFDISVSVF